MSLHKTIAGVICLVIAAHFSLRAAADEPAPRSAVTKADVEQWMKSLSNWGRWGKNDELGTLNLITPEKRRQAAALVRDGVSVSLAHDVVKQRLDDSSPFEHQVLINKPAGDVGGAGDRYSVAYHGFTQTHIDALCHIFYRGQLYNGFSASEVQPAGAGRLSVNRLKNGIFTRAVLMDLPVLFGVRYLEAGRAIYPKDLEAWEAKIGTKVESGDALLINTGRWTRREIEGPWDILQGSAGLHASCLPWLKARDVAVIGSDLALDVLPSGVEGFEMPVHCGVVVSLGMCILDCCDLRAVAQEAQTRNRWEFLLTVQPLAVEGGTGSPINPVGTF
jgi:kynurenine formamidase